MGVQDVVALLNKSKPITSNKTPLEPVPPLPPMKDIEKKANKIKTNTSLGIAANMKKFDQSNTNDHHPPTPPESPVSTTTKKTSTAHVTPNSDLSRFDAIAAELIEMHSALIKHTEDSDNYIQKLQSDVDKYASDVTKVRDYEIRVEYLAQKLEQLSEERDQLEEELTALRRQGPPLPAPPIPPVASNHTTSPLSPAFTQYFNQNMTIEKAEKQNDEFMADFLNVYEEIPTEDDPLDDQVQIFDEQNTNPKDEISVLNERLVECDKGVQMTIVKYVTDLETQRLEVKRLKQVVKKQDELISKLEMKLKSNGDELLREQVDLQKIELENKRELLTHLLNEREELLHSRRFSQRTSMDLLSEFKRPPSFQSTLSRHSSFNGRGSPPPTAPPRQPLPPLPLRQDSILR